MSSSLASRKRLRKSFEKLKCAIDLPNLIDLQKFSYDQFLQKDIPPASREKLGLQEVFLSIFPIKDFAGKSHLEFIHYQVGEPKFSLEEAKQKGVTYASPLIVTLRLVVWDIDEDTQSRSIKDMKEQEVYMGDIPLMTDNGTFVVNGVERVVVSQMHRSPGVFFDHDRGKTHASGKYIFSARVIPYRGSWLDFEFDSKDILYVRIDRRRKLPVTTLLMALENEAFEKKCQALDKSATDPGLDFKIQGMSRQDILGTYYQYVTYERHDKGWSILLDPHQWHSVKLLKDMIDADTGKIIFEAGKRVSPRLVKKVYEEGVRRLLYQDDDILGKFSAHDMIDEKTGEILIEAGQEITSEVLEALKEAKLDAIVVLGIDYLNKGPSLRNTLALDRNNNRDEALIDIYRVMNPGEPPTLEAARALFHNLFFVEEKYDLSAVGRVKMNARLSFDEGGNKRILSKQDIVEIIRILLDLKDGKGDIDDIDNLGNRRVRPVGELIENQYRTGLVRMERAIKERMSTVELDSVMPHDLLNTKPISSAIKEFFSSSQLSQFMDQVNPLAEITHKRRLSALGPGGLTRDRATFEVRDVHPTHYGRICPIETPEGPNIGLINSLASFARVNRYGFIESPYRIVKDGYVQETVVYLSAMEEGRFNIAQSDAKIDDGGKLADEFVNCRKGGDFTIVPSVDVHYIDVAPKQLVSIAASLIPFLENDDANRALMGSNMQRQAVPLIRAQAPLVGTGMEQVVAKDSGVTVVAKRSGIVDQVDAERIVVRTDKIEKEEKSVVDIYKLHKFQRSNHSTCILQRPRIRIGDYVEKGDVIADGPATEQGELALGSNALVAFMSWNGYNFEDSIILSERMVKDDVFTSIHIEEFEVMARDTKLGQEEITRDIPNMGDEALRHLDEAGIAAIGSEVEPGDILVGKVTPKGESPVTPEEKLLRAIFGEKVSDVRDSSLRVPPGVHGTVVEVRVFSRRGVEKDERSLAIDQAQIRSYENDLDVERRILENALASRIRDLLKGQILSKAMGSFQKGEQLDMESLADMSLSTLRKVHVQQDDLQNEIQDISQEHDKIVKNLQKSCKEKIEKLRRGDELPTGVLKSVKIFIASKRKIQPGDKMAGRHGNKGVVSCIVPEEDMPYLPDGRPVDIILNPLGVPSRMNVGQILETHLGWASAGLGRQISDMLSKVYRQEEKLSSLRSLVKNMYPGKEDKDHLEHISEADLVETSLSLTKGIPMATPVFDGAREEDVTKALAQAYGESVTSGQVTLYDGMTGEPFDRQITVGYIYMLKLNHMVDDKLHARSVGPYSLVTQQPLGGKAQFGGQRFGEMEVWALEAYGASYTLQEMLTVKSDDVIGRTKVYESIIKGDDTFEYGIPESFNVLVKELRSLGLDMDLLKHEV